MTDAQAAAPVVAGLFETAEDGVHLLGSRCASCGALYFPVTLSCRNPDCEVKAIGPARLPRTGVLYSHTIQYYRPPPLFPMEPWSPYALGLVEFEGGLRVMGMMTGGAVDDLRIGMEVEAVVEPLGADAAGWPVLTYKFAPLRDRGRA